MHGLIYSLVSSLVSITEEVPRSVTQFWPLKIISHCMCTYALRFKVRAYKLYQSPFLFLLTAFGKCEKFKEVQTLLLFFSFLPFLFYSRAMALLWGLSLCSLSRSLSRFSSSSALRPSNSRLCFLVALR